ncbi:MAG: hypothetical protein AB1704_26275 [Pseudomonadota bacterium]|jgi:hypothetical protein|uniref:hypothetical protein n=1 Tax=Burkholderiaceae TaxID=119060 RepID=UPI0010F659DB|nr:hypothetical protein [Burkholderia sp. 4M9327F10]
MLDTDFLRLAWLAWLVYGGDTFAACVAFEQFDATRHINRVNLSHALRDGFEVSRRTHAWLVGERRIPLSQFVEDVAHARGRVSSEIAGGWTRPVLIRRAHL